MAMNMDAMLRIKADVQGENNIRRLGSSLQNLQGQAKTVGMGFNALKGAVAGFGAAIAGSAIVGGLTAIVKKSIDAGDELFNMQAKTGIAANALIALGNAAKLADVDQATLGKGLTRLSVNLVKAAEGNDALAQKFKALGVSVKDSSGQVVPADKALKQIADRFADMPDGAQKAAAAVALFGKSGAELIPLLNEGAAAMEKFTFKVSDDFAARSDLFNDTITEFGIKTQGFGLELTDALLPALQSILEVFGDLFDTKQDWTALFDVIKFGLRTIATIIYATIKLVDQLIKAVVYSFDAIGKALQGDFEAAGRALSQGFGAGLEQAKRDFEQIGKLWSDSPSPGTGRRTSGRNMDLDTSAADRSAASASSKAAAEAKRAAAERARDAQEQERLAERRNDLTQKAIGMQEQLRNSLEDVRAATAGVGVGPVDSLLNERSNAITDNTRLMKDLTLGVIELKREVEAAGGELELDVFKQLINGIGDANEALADKKLTQGLIDLLPPLEDYDAKIAELTGSKAELSEVEKLNAQVNLLQLDILAATNPALAEHIRLLRERAGALDETRSAMAGDWFGGGMKDGLNQYIESVGTLREGMANLAVTGVKGIEDALFSLVTTGKANFKEFAVEILKLTARMIIQQLILRAIMQAIGAISGGGAPLGFGGASDPLGAGGAFWNAKGNAFGASGVIPYANGGIVNSPTLFKFASGGAMRTGVMGEAGPEAIMPLKRGADGKLGVAGGGGTGTTNVTVNVDASGSSQVSGNPGQAAALGRAVSQAVQQELIKQKRPGGLLTA